MFVGGIENSFVNYFHSGFRPNWLLRAVPQLKALWDIYGDVNMEPPVIAAPDSDLAHKPSLDRSSVTIRPHPQGVKPIGNQYVAARNARDGIGTFRVLPDEVIVILLEYVDSASLRLLGSTCQAFYAFCRFDDIWKALFVRWSTGEAANTHFKWQGCWRSTYLSLQTSQLPLVSCHDVFSDVLYRPFLCANIPLAPYVTGIPSRNAITRLDDLSPTDFASYWNDRPFVLTKPIKEWPIYKTWDTSSLLDEYSETRFRAEAVDWPLRSYVSYMHNNLDESPLYLFDKSFVEKMRLKVGRNYRDAKYWIPDCFGEDLFAVLGDRRPNSRWLIIGPARSGSTFHKDPNATSAWNAVLRGSKYWIMFPTEGDSPPPPGVYVSKDHSEVTSPQSIAEWLIGFHEIARKTPGCLEGICGEGEVMHVPSGWWHLVVNLETSIAITQNFVPRSHLPSVLSFLKYKPDQVSGFKRDVVDPYSTFVHCMDEQYPELLAQAMSGLGERSETRKRKWETVVRGSGIDEFRFGLGGNGDSDEDIP